MTTTTSNTAVRIIEILEDEDGTQGWAIGHVDPTLVVLSLVVERMQNVGAEEAMQMLLGGPTTYCEGERHTYDKQVDQANGILASVRHVWLRQDADDDEKMHPANEGDVGAEPFTMVEIPW